MLIDLQDTIMHLLVDKAILHHTSSLCGGSLTLPWTHGRGTPLGI